MTPLSLSLRQQTRTLHDEVERSPLNAAILDGTLTLDKYRLLLQKMYGFHEPFETIASRYTEWHELGFNFDERRRARLLQQDLQSLGCGADDIGALPQACLTLTGKPFSVALGYFYVLEGSTLGGQVISKLIQERLAVQPDCGGAYFKAYGKCTRQRWAECQVFLDNYGTVSGCDDEVVWGACQAYRDLGGWLTTPSAGQ